MSAGNHPGRSDAGVTAETASEMTVNLSDVIAQVRELERARAAAEKRAAVAKVKREPLPWSAAWVFVVFALVALGAWVAYLAYM